MENPPKRSTPSAGPDASRRARDALLLELGALVYELHRKGRRAPELLQAKATALDEIEAEAPPGESPSLPCPHCFTATEPGQLVCLQCGEALGVGGPGQPRRRPTALLVLAAVVALLGAAAAGFAVSELTSDDGDAQAGARRAATSVASKKEKLPSGGVAGAEQSSGQGGPVALAAWPADQSAYTVILVTSSDEKGARRVASEAARSGLEAGLLRSNDYADLGKGFWLVFAGRYPDAATAERRAARLGARFEGAYPQQVVPTG